MQLQRECKGAIIITSRTPEQRARKVIAWKCDACAAQGEYPLNAVPAKGTFRHTWQAGPTGVDVLCAEADAQEARA